MHVLRLKEDFVLGRDLIIEFLFISVKALLSRSYFFLVLSFSDDIYRRRKRKLSVHFSHLIDRIFKTSLLVIENRRILFPKVINCRLIRTFYTFTWNEYELKPSLSFQLK